MKNQVDSKQDEAKISSNHLKNNNKSANPPGGSAVIEVLQEDMPKKFEQDLHTHAERHAEAYHQYKLRLYRPEDKYSDPPPPRRRRRYVGALHTMADYRREMAALYKEAYYGNIPWDFLTRASYALTCMMQAAAMDKSPTKSGKTT